MHEFYYLKHFSIHLAKLAVKMVNVMVVRFSLIIKPYSSTFALSYEPMVFSWGKAMMKYVYISLDLNNNRRLWKIEN